jgi:hypothetical protein
VDLEEIAAAVARRYEVDEAVLKRHGHHAGMAKAVAVAVASRLANLKRPNDRGTLSDWLVGNWRYSPSPYRPAGGARVSSGAVPALVWNLAPVRLKRRPVSAFGGQARLATANLLLGRLG